MVRTTIAELLARNERHAESLPDDYFAAVEESQSPAVVSVCCSDSRVSQEGMWDVDEPGWLFAVANIGNQTWDTHGGETVVSGDVLYPLLYADPDARVVTVVGHSGCGAVTATLEAVQSDREKAVPPGVEKRIEWLRPVVEAGLDDPRVDPEAEASIVDQLVEYNVDRQVACVRDSDEVPEETTVLGFVYDFQRVYGDMRGRCYFVNHDSETDLGALEERVPDGYEHHVERLLA
jgi:carbonic anhydrase